jgi:hypothetical protein
LPAWVTLGEAFLLIVVAGALWATFRSLRRLAPRAVALPAGLFVFALGVRFAAHAVPANIRDVIDILRWPGRAGWSCYLNVLFSVLPATHESVWNVHRVLGALAVPLLYAVMLNRFSPLAATAGAATLAVLPFAARFAASDTPCIPLCTAFLGATLALDRFGRSGSRSALALGLGLLTCAMQLRPEGPWLVVPAAILFACRPVERRWIARPSVFGIVACFVALNVPFSAWALVASDTDTTDYLGGFIGAGALWGSPWLDPNESPWPVAILVIAGGVSAARMGRAGVCWLVATVVAFPLAQSAWGQLAHARYHLLSVHLACGLAGIAVAALLERLARRRGAPFGAAAAAAFAVLIPVAGALPRVDFLFRMWTPQLEFERFREGVRALGTHCTVVTLLDGMDAGFMPFTDPGRADLVDVERFHADGRDGCVVYYRAANCFAPAVGRPDVCRAFEDRFSLTPISETMLPAIPYQGERYTRDPIPVGFFRITPPTGAREGP